MDFGSKDIYIVFPFSLFVSVYVYASVCDFVFIALLLPFVLGFSLSSFSCLFITFKNFFLNNYFLFILITLFYFILLYLLLSFYFFSLLF